MNLAAKLAVYSFGLAAIFGASAAAGSALGPIDVGGATHSGAGHSTATASPAMQPGAAVASSTTEDRVDGYTVTRTAAAVSDGSWSISFTVTRDGAMVTTDPYLGEAGHLVMIREADFAYLQAHPTPRADSTVSFDAHLPSPGTYRLYFDFSAGGGVHTAAFVFDVPGTAKPPDVSGSTASADQQGGTEP